MKVLKKESSVEEVVFHLRRGELVCFPTDTLYGILGYFLDSSAVEKVYRLKGRDREKPLILLFPSLTSVEEFGVELRERELLEKIFPAPLTVILPLKGESPLRKVLKRNNVAVRIPKDRVLLEILEKVYPLFAPSANPQGLKPAENCKECKNYFKDAVPLCVEGKFGGKPSTIVDLTGKEPKVLREGAFPFLKFIKGGSF